MKRTMFICELPPIEDPRKPVQAVVSVKSPGIVRQTSVMAKPTAISVITRATGRDPQVELIPVVIFEIDPDAESRDLKLTIIPHGMTISVEEPVKLEFLGVFTYPQGIPFYLFEEFETGNGEG